MIDIERLAREAGFVAYGEDYGEYRIPTPAFKNRMEGFAALVLEEAAKVCAAEKVNYELTQHAADEAYNMAVDHCADAIRALKQ
jgi:hypothetical protein